VLSDDATALVVDDVDGSVFVERRGRIADLAVITQEHFVWEGLAVVVTEVGRHAGAWGLVFFEFAFDTVLVGVVVCSFAVFFFHLDVVCDQQDSSRRECFEYALCVYGELHRVVAAQIPGLAAVEGLGKFLPLPGSVEGEEAAVFSDDGHLLGKDSVVIDGEFGDEYGLAVDVFFQEANSHLVGCADEFEVVHGAHDRAVRKDERFHDGDVLVPKQARRGPRGMFVFRVEHGKFPRGGGEFVLAFEIDVPKADETDIAFGIFPEHRVRCSSAEEFAWVEDKDFFPSLAVVCGGRYDRELAFVVRRSFGLDV